MIDLKGKSCIELDDAIRDAGHFLYELDGKFVASDEAAIQAIIDDFEMPLPNLTPREFKYLLAATGIKQAVDILLPALYETDREVYARIYSQLEGARYYEWTKTVAMKDYLALQLQAINPDLNLDTENLKVLWAMAYAID